MENFLLQRNSPYENIPSMSPMEWREKSGKTLEQLSSEIGFAKGYLSEVETGKKPGSLRLAKAYEKVSNGKVTLADFNV